MDINFLDNNGYRKVYENAQRDLIAEYRANHPEFKNLSDAEIALMCPVSPEVFDLYASNMLAKIEAVLSEIKDEIQSSKKRAYINYTDRDNNSDLVFLNIRENNLYTDKYDILKSIKAVREAYETRER